MRHKHRTLAGSVIVSSLALIASPASAADGLLFSVDGENWGAALHEPLFSDSVLVPGAQVSRSFWIRNGSEHSAELAIAIMDGELSSAAAPGSLWIKAAVAGQEQGAGPGQAAQERVILAMPSMNAAHSQRITVTVGLGGEARNVMQEQSAPVQFEVRLTEAVPSMDGGRQVPVEERADLRGPDAESSLSDTGFGGLWLAVLGASLIVGGWIAVMRNRSTSDADGGRPHGTM